MKLYNTATKRLEEFHPSNPNEVKIYTCGPTVYSAPHIGNFAAYIYWDLLIRTLMANGYNVRRILNLTDVGHLTSDGDTGEDKLEKGAKREGKSVWEISDYYIDIFKKGFKKLGLIEPTKWARATDYIEQSEQLVEKLFVWSFVIPVFLFVRLPYRISRYTYTVVWVGASQIEIFIWQFSHISQAIAIIYYIIHSVFFCFAANSNALTLEYMPT